MKVAAKMQQRSLNHVKVQYYQKWKNLVLQQGSGSNNDKMLEESNIQEVLDFDVY